MIAHDHQSSVTDHQSSIINKKSSIIIHRSSVIDHHSPIISHLPCAIDHQPSIIFDTLFLCRYGRNAIHIVFIFNQVGLGVRFTTSGRRDDWQPIYTHCAGRPACQYRSSLVLGFCPSMGVVFICIQSFSSHCHPVLRFQSDSDLSSSVVVKCYYCLFVNWV